LQFSPEPDILFLSVETVNTKNTMRKFTLPFSYTVNGEIEIEASNLSTAIYKFNQMALHQNPSGDFPILDKATKLDPDADTMEVDEDEAEDINTPIKWNVQITRTQTVTVEVEAHSEDEAEELAKHKVHDGDMEDYFSDEGIEVGEVEEAGE